MRCVHRNGGPRADDDIDAGDCKPIQSNTNPVYTTSEFNNATALTARVQG